MTTSGTAAYDDRAELPPLVVEAARTHWLDHPRLRTAEVRVTPTSATLLGTYLG